MAEGDKRSLILDAAVSILKKESYSNMRTMDVARLAGVAEGTIYLYFSSKKNLFIEAVKEVNTRLSSVLLAGVADNAGLFENLGLMVRSFLSRQKETDGYYRVIYRAFAEVDDPEIRDVLRVIYEHGVSLVSGILQKSSRYDGMPVNAERADQAAEFLWGAGDVLWKRAAVAGDTGNSADAEQIMNILKTVLEMIRKEEVMKNLLK